MSAHRNGFIDLNGVSTPIVVLKFGSSVLRTTDDLPRVIAEIYRITRQGVKVIAVVSAFAGETDRLIAEATNAGAFEDSVFAPRLIALGEERAAALLALACDEAGLQPRVMTARSLDLHASGHPARAEPTSLNQSKLLEALGENDVIITPGFVAIGDNDEPVLLGRGGTDLTAIILAEALGLGEATLVKDVDGVFDRDPAKYADAARRYGHISYDDALERAGELVQARAIKRAAKDEIDINVRRLGVRHATIVGARSDAPGEPCETPPLRVALAGCGIVGSALADLIAQHAQDFDLCGVMVRDLKKKRPESLGAAKVVTSQEALFETKPDIIVDVLSSGDVGLELTRNALARRVSIASANKQALADELKDLAGLGDQNGAALQFSASVGGGAPMIETVRRARKQGQISSIKAVVNGTVNYILSELALGRDFQSAVEAAQRAGFAEADPTADLSGADAIAKAKILAREAFDLATDEDFPCQALDEDALAEISGSPGIWRQVTTVTCQDGVARGEVAIVKVSSDDFLAELPGEANAIKLVMADGSEVCVRGRGAGPVPTAHSVFSDLGFIRRNLVGDF